MGEEVVDHVGDGKVTRGHRTGLLQLGAELVELLPALRLGGRVHLGPFAVTRRVVVAELPGVAAAVLIPEDRTAALTAALVHCSLPPSVGPYGSLRLAGAIAAGLPAAR